jgi:hypothetical protein
MPYEIFKRTGIRVEEPTVAITPRGTIVFNAAASRIMVGAAIKAVFLLWDKSANKLAFKAASRKDKDAFVVSQATGRSSGSLKAKSFLTYIGWQAKKRESFSATWNEEEKMLEITLPWQHIVGAPVSGGGPRRIRLE